MTDQTHGATTPAADLDPAGAYLAGFGRSARAWRSSWLFRALSIAVVLALWEWAGRMPVSPTFPTFTATAVALYEMLADGSLIVAYGETLKPMIIGIALCGIFGIGFGLLMGMSRTFEWATLPVWVITQAAPMGAIIPLIIVVYGIGVAAKVAAVVLMAAPIVVLNAYTGIRNVNAG